MNKGVKVEVFQSASPTDVNMSLFQDELLPKLLPASERIFRMHHQTLDGYSEEEVKKRFTQLKELVSLEKHIEVTLENQRLDWKLFLEKILTAYPQLVWVRGGEEELHGKEFVYYFDLIPLVVKEKGFPFLVNLTESLEQQLYPRTDDVLKTFCSELELLAEELSSDYSSEKEAERKREVAKEIDISEQQVPLQSFDSEPVVDEREPVSTAMYQEESASTSYKGEMVRKEEVFQERNAKERVKLANQKLEILMNQMEKQMIHISADYLTERKERDSTDDWYKYIRIDLREYSRLFQKAKYLEQTWLTNQALETKNEKMTISEREWTYEREQVRQIKEATNPEEIFLMLEECNMIEKRIKIRRIRIFGKPTVKIMKMDYENLVDKATYFDLLQGENCLLDKEVKRIETIEQVKSLEEVHSDF